MPIPIFIAIAAGIAALVGGGAGVKARLEDGETVLMAAAINNPNPDVITALIKAGADVKAKDGDGKTALDYAKENEKIKNTDAYRQLNEARY